MMKEAVKQLKAYVPEEPISAIAARLGLSRVVRLSANENPYGHSPKVTVAVQEAAAMVGSAYPDGNATALRNALAAKYGLVPQQFVIGCGLDEIIMLLTRVFVSAGNNIVTAAPTFSEYALNAGVEGATVRAVPVDATGANDLEAMAAKVDEATALVWVCNPNNPTGGANTLADIEAFVQKVPTSTLVIIDEAYIEFADSSIETALPLLDTYPHVIVLRTFSKAYGLANYRVGYAITTPKLANYLETVRLPYNLNSISQAAALAALADSRFIEDTVAANKAERDSLEALLTDLNIEFYPSDTNFIFFKVPNANTLADDLMHAGYLVRRGLAPDCLRLTIGQAEDNKIIKDIITRFAKAHC